MQSTRTKKEKNSAAVAVFAIAVLILLMFSAPFSPLYLATSTIFLYPFLLMMLCVRGGWQAALTSLIIMGVANYMRMGAGILVITIVYLAPLTAVLLLCLRQEVPFWKTAAALAAAYTLSVLALYVGITWLTKGQAYTIAIEQMMQGLDAIPGRDTLLYALIRSGAISLSGLPENTPVFDETTRDIVFLPGIISELYNQIRYRLDLLFRALPLTLVTSFGLLLSTMGLYVSVYASGKRIYKGKAEDGTLAFDERYPLPQMPPFSTWHISRKLSLYLIPLAAIYLITLGMGGTMRLAGQMMFAVFTTIYSIQGLSVLNWWLKKWNVSVPLRSIVLLMFFLMFQGIAFWVGLAEQLFDSRALRRHNNDHHTLIED